MRDNRRRNRRGQVLPPKGKQRSWAIRFYAYGKRRYVTLGRSDEGWDRRHAERELGHVLADVERGIWRPIGPDPGPETDPDPTFHEFASQWYEGLRHEGLRETTLADYHWQLSSHLLPFFARHRLSEITIEQVDRYRRVKVGEERLSPTSINKTITRLGQILEVAVERELILRNPAKVGGKRRKLKTRQPERSYLDRTDQLESLLGAAGELDQIGRGPKNRRLLLATLLFAGLRLSEALNLRWRDVDLAARRLRVIDSKTDAGVREVELLPLLCEELATHKAGWRNLSGSELVFATGTGGAQNPSNVRNRILAGSVKLANECREQAGLGPLPQGLTPHSLRRTFISLLLAAGEDPPYVMRQVGHSDPKVTLGIYAQVMLRKGGERERLRALVHGNIEIPDARSQLNPEATE
ncbi:MAG: tyrosine-type recombinase/integrase [Solirubrobacterales bacterium]